MASNIADQYTKRSLSDYNELVKADQYLLHAAVVGIAGVAFSAHSDVLTGAGLFGGYIGAQKTYAGPLGKAKLYLEAASAAQCVEKNSAKLLSAVGKLNYDSLSIIQLEEELYSSLNEFDLQIYGFRNLYHQLKEEEKQQFDSAFSQINLGKFSNFKEIYDYGLATQEKLRGTLELVDGLPFLIIDKLKQIDMEVSRRFITESVDIDTVIASLKSGQSEQSATGATGGENIQASAGMPPEPERNKSLELITIENATLSALDTANHILNLSNLYYSRDLSSLGENTRALKSCIVATVQIND